ncbi:MAG: Lrp/AsnC family transcriptional regulator [Erysipelotrichaceae bacterium]
METLLHLLNQNARTSIKDLAVMSNQSEKAVEDQIKAYEASGIIKGYQALIDWDKVKPSPVFALIELKVSPKKDMGFQEIADRVCLLPEVQSVYLMAGDYDLAVLVKGETMQDVAMFVAKRLSILDSVLSTATHFILARYKQDGVILGKDEEEDPRGQMVI